MKLGNGIETRYTYRPDNRRLKNLNSEGKTAGKFQNLDYTYDSVGNITDLANSVDLPKPGAFGGPTAQTFGYDDLYRLTSATGRFTSSPSKVRDYTLGMGYDDIHNITAKTQLDTLSSSGGKPIEQKATSYDWAYAYGAQQPHAPTHIGSHSYSYDLNGNQLGWEDDKSGARRIILWDEDNRIAEILDNGQSSKYIYDDQGQRVIKETKQGETVYVNQYYVVRNRSIVSKHLFAGSSRLVTRLEMGTAKGNSNQGSGSNPTSFASADSSDLTSHGNSGQQHGNSGQQHGNQGNAYGHDQDNPGQGNAQGQGNNATSNGNGKAQGKGNSGSHGPSTGSGQAGSTNLPGNSEKGLENALANGQGNKYGIYKHLAKEGYSVDEGGNIVVDAGDGNPITSEVPPAQVNGQSDFTYYYHPDHLGSTGFVTDASGKLYEHIEYFPFGETWVQEHSNTLRTPYLFTGKEYDQETGLNGTNLREESFCSNR
jgi:YD repeat-containing protein